MNQWIHQYQSQQAQEKKERKDKVQLIQMLMQTRHFMFVGRETRQDYSQMVAQILSDVAQNHLK